MDNVHPILHALNVTAERPHTSLENMATLMDTRSTRDVSVNSVHTLEAAQELALSWPAILAGAAASAALSLILLALGTGLGLSSISPYSSLGASAKMIGAGAIIWLLLMSGIASGVGGYIAGRLRTKWRFADADEAHFRDTAHGFLAWAVATIVAAGILTSAASSMVGVAKVGVDAAVVAAGSEAATSSSARESGERYFADMMLRGSKPADVADQNGARREVDGILANALTSGDIAQGDRAYLAQLVASRTGMSATEAEQRVAQTVSAAKTAAESAKAKAKEAADTARKVTAYTALWVFISLLVGAFYASLAATWGGRRRDGAAG